MSIKVQFPVQEVQNVYVDQKTGERIVQFVSEGGNFRCPYDSSLDIQKGHKGVVNGLLTAQGFNVQNKNGSWVQCFLRPSYIVSWVDYGPIYNDPDNFFSTQQQNSNSHVYSRDDAAAPSASAASSDRSEFKAKK